MDRPDPSYKGQSGYNAAMLAIYDAWVLRFMTKASGKFRSQRASTATDSTWGADTSTSVPGPVFLGAANKQGGFDNLGDTEEGLRRILRTSFDDVDVRVVGSAAFFVAARPRSSP